jgi:hypothetical protein
VNDRERIVRNGDPLLRSTAWQRPDWPALERFQLLEKGLGFELHGVVVAVIAGEPLSCEYRVSCSREWQTTDVRVQVEQDSGIRELQLSRDSQGNWRRAGVPLPEFRGLADVDLAITPATNTLPIRRLQLERGQQADAAALWVQFPDLTLEQLPQKYERIGERSYQYESGDGDFRAVLEVDELGLIVRYGNFWQRIAQGPVVSGRAT